MVIFIFFLGEILRLLLRGQEIRVFRLVAVFCAGPISDVWLNVHPSLSDVYFSNLTVQSSTRRWFSFIVSPHTQLVVRHCCCPRSAALWGYNATSWSGSCWTSYYCNVPSVCKRLEFLCFPGNARVRVDKASVFDCFRNCQFRILLRKTVSVFSSILHPLPEVRWCRSHTTPTSRPARRWPVSRCCARSQLCRTPSSLIAQQKKKAFFPPRYHRGLQPLRAGEKKLNLLTVFLYLI